jgi:membrane-associated protease RseP (regulator of RpoE activity)
VVLAAGSFMHFVIALLVMYAAIAGFGEPTRETTRISDVSACVTPDPEKDCAGQPPSPALVAGVKEGDRVVAFDGTEIAKWTDFTPLVQAHEAGPAELVVLRDGQRVPLPVDIVRAPELGKDDKPTGRTIGRVGLLPGETKHYGLLAAVPRSGALLWELTTGSVQAMVDLPGAVGKLFSDNVVKDEKREISGGGPVGIVDLGRISAGAFEARDFLSVLSLIAALNVFVGLFNLLPLLPLDGGHLAILGFEQARSRLYRMVGRRDPGRVDLRKLMPAMVAFIVVMGSVALMLIYAGIANPIDYPK